MPEIYAYEQSELDKARSCIVNGGRIILIALIFSLIMGGLCYRALTIIGG